MMFAATPAVAMTLWPQAWPIPGSASYSQRIATVGPSPVSMVARNAVATPATPRSTLKPCLSRKSPSHAAALTSWYASSGLSWICRDSFSRSSARRSTACGTRSLTPLMMGLPEVSARPRGAAGATIHRGRSVEPRAACGYGCVRTVGGLGGEAESPIEPVVGGLGGEVGSPIEPVVLGGGGGMTVELACARIITARIVPPCRLQSHIPGGISKGDASGTARGEPDFRRKFLP